MSPDASDALLQLAAKISCFHGLSMSAILFLFQAEMRKGSLSYQFMMRWLEAVKAGNTKLLNILLKPHDPHDPAEELSIG